MREQLRQEQEKADRERVDKLMADLPQHEWQRAKALDELRREIQRDVQQNPSFQAILMKTELEKLAQLHASFVRLASACQRAESYLQAVNLNDLKKQADAQARIQDSSQDEQVRELARKNANVIEKRLSTIRDIEAFLARRDNSKGDAG